MRLADFAQGYTSRGNVLCIEDSLAGGGVSVPIRNNPCCLIYDPYGFIYDPCCFIYDPWGYPYLFRTSLPREV
ncbi:MAG: hypothetical protein LBS04_04640 [Tannerellaceae bacterium]|nr:hypothetical protein [Tannerellaceae bacterium]